ncbi:MAG: tRNA (guanosine(37)-N1)-methyltransferase TrmD [Candidatus Paceibacterota bacterium]
MHFHIITLFPESFESYLRSSIIGRAVHDENIKVSFYNPRDYTKDKHARVDQKPYGGGPGMVIQAEPVLRAVKDAVGRKKNVKIVFMEADGDEFSNEYARTWSKKYKHIVLVAGRYEGIDARARRALNADAVTIGPYVLTGGELPAMVIMDATARQIEGVLGDEKSREEERIASHEVYTRPEKLKWKGKVYEVPEVLRSGDHKKIDQWREERS